MPTAAGDEPSDGERPTARLSIGDAIRQGVTFLAGSSSPRLDAEVLLADVLGIDRSALLVRDADAVAPRRAAAYRAALARRAAGEPVAYITGRSHFFGLELSVGPGVLVPRPETELLVEWALERLSRVDRPSRVVDVGTGSGAIALAVARACPDAIVYATDTDAIAIRQARDNAKRLGLEDRVRLHEADLLPADDTEFDVVVANLPYIAADDPDLAPEVHTFEPHGALYAGVDGLTAIRRLALVAPGRLAPDGALGLEIGWRQADDVVSLLRTLEPEASVSVAQDLAGRDRLVVADRRPPRERADVRA